MTARPQHTPGPWRWRMVWDRTACPTAVLLETEHRPVPCNDPCILAIREDWLRSFVEMSPDARLIAAAPDLLAACENVAEGIAGALSDDESAQEWVESLRAAILKARGTE